MLNVQKSCWYREPWVWVNILLLGSTCVGGLLLLVICLQHAPEPTMVSMHTQAQTRDQSQNIHLSGMPPAQ